MPLSTTLIWEESFVATVQRPEPGVGRPRASPTPGLLIFAVRCKNLVA